MATIAKINGIAIANIAKINNIAKANIAKVDGISLEGWFTPTAIHSKCGQEVGKECSKTIDGNLSTAWWHTVEHEHWVIFDLGSTKTVKKVRLYCRGNGNTNICEVSAIYINNTHDESGGSKGSSSIVGGTQWYEIDVTDTNGRYIKLKLKTYDILDNCVITEGMVNFYEFEAFVAEYAPTYEDFTTFTEVDVAADRIQKTANHIDHYQKRGESTYLYKDYGVGHFGNFTHKIKIKRVSDASLPAGYVWIVANNICAGYTLRAYNHVEIQIGGGTLYLLERYNNGSYYDTYTSFSTGTWYYIKLVKSGTSMYCYIYSDANYSTLVDTLHITLHVDGSYRYLYPCNSYNEGTTTYATFDIENFDIGE